MPKSFADLLRSHLDFGTRPDTNQRGATWLTDDLCAAAQIDRQNLDNWLAGQNRPMDANLIRLCNALFGQPPADHHLESWRALRDAAKRTRGARANPPQPVATSEVGGGPLVYHNVLEAGDRFYFLGSRPNLRDTTSYWDPQGVEFKSRLLYVGWHAKSTREWHCVDRPLRLRFSHTAMRMVGGHLVIFMNSKRNDHSFNMWGLRYRVSPGLVFGGITEVFADRNWGWSPSVDEHGRVHHGSSVMENGINPYLIDTEILPGKTWLHATQQAEEWSQQTCPFERVRASGHNGYQQRLVTPAGFGPWFPDD